MTHEPVARPVVGFRAWALDARGQLLSTSEAFNGGSRTDPPPAARRAWSDTARGASAFCRRTARPGLCADARWCDCGLHAYARPRAWPRSGLVHGVVVAWGRIVVHAHGFRAEHARPVAFLDQPCAGFDRLLERSGLPALGPAELSAYALWHGDVLDVPEERRAA